MKPLVAIDHAGLRQRASAAADPEGALTLARSLIAWLDPLHGDGLAAPQVGIDSRVAVVEFEEQRFVLVNPSYQVRGKPRERVAEIEGCLSLGKRRFMVMRYPEITVVTHLLTGPVAITARGWLARIFQHELDHLDGQLIDARGEELSMAVGQ